MRIGIAYDLKKDQRARGGGAPEDLFEEYDSEETVDAIARAIASAGHEPVKLGGGRRLMAYLLAGVPAVDLVFNLAEGRGGTRSREAQVPAVCEALGVPYTHSDPLTCALTLDKALAKRVVASFGVATPRAVLVEGLEDLEALPGAALPPFPAIAKPDFEGSSMGVRRSSRVETRSELESLVQALLDSYGEAVLVEEYLPGAEITVPVLGTGADARVLGAMEIAPRRGPRDRFIYSLEVKRNYLEEVDYHVPPRLDEGSRRAVEETALRAYRALGCRDVARVDLRLAADGTPHFLEVNPLPGLNPVTGDLPICAGRVGVAYEALIARILEASLARLGQLECPVA